MEAQFDLEGKKLAEVNAVEGGDLDEDLDDFDQRGVPGHSDSEDDGEQPPSGLKLTAGIRQAVRRLHENTGHRSNKRLARALTLSGAPPEVVWAARHHQCDICKDKVGPKSRRPASLPTPKDCGDHCHIDLLEVYDSGGSKFVVVHMTDWATRFQLAEIIPDKSSQSVISFVKRRWLPIFGAPRVLIADQGKEFVSWQFTEFCESVSTLLWHCAVQSPWQNGVAEKSGGILRTLMAAIITANSVIGRAEMDDALGEALGAYNSDCNESGMSPQQAAVGRQPLQSGDVLGGVRERLSEHGLIDESPSYARQLALRETAKLAMTRLHFSRGLRRAELARSRSSTQQKLPQPGDVCYFYRMSKYNSKTVPSRKKLTLKKWHGPALLVALEGDTNAFLSFKGQLTKCSLEHVRAASTLEQIAASSWREAIEEAVQLAVQDITARGLEAGDVGTGLDSQAPPAERLDLARQELPPVAPREVVASLQQGASVPPQSSMPPSGLTSILSSRRVSAGP